MPALPPAFTPTPSSGTNPSSNVTHDGIIVSAQIGSVKQIPDDLASSQLDTAILTDPLKIQAYKATIAGQMNKQTSGPVIEDLTERISDVSIETSAQGASLLTITVIDPFWTLLTVEYKGGTFIQVNQEGYLAPIDVNFPNDTNCFWRLAQVRYNIDLSAANGTLTFEDRIVSIMRQMSAATDGSLTSIGTPSMTLGAFIKALVDATNKKYHTDIRLLELISPQDPNYQSPNPTTVKHNKGGGTGVTKAMQDFANGVAKSQSVNQKNVSMRELERELHSAFPGGSNTWSGAPPTGPTSPPPPGGIGGRG